MNRKRALFVLFGLLAAAVANARDSQGDGLPVCRPWTAGHCAVQMAGVLRRERSGEPLPGKQLRFVAGGSGVCVAVTDDGGRGSCVAVVPDGPALLRDGWQVRFEGDGDLAPAIGDESRGPDRR